MNKRLTVALVAHDNMKHDLAEWVAWNWEKLLSHRLVCTGTTGRIVAETLMERRSKDAANSRFDITMLKSGPLGGDQQLGAMIANGDIDMLIFFWDPMSAQPPTHIDFMPPNYHTCADFICFAHGNYLFLL